MKKIAFGLFLLSLTACRPFDMPDNGQGTNQTGSIDVKNKTMSQLNVPNGFTFTTSKSVNIAIEARDNAGNTLQDVDFGLYVIDKDSQDSVFLMTARTNTEGVFTTKINLEPTAERLIAMTEYIGLPSYQTVNIGSSSNIKLSFGTENTKRNGIVNGIEPVTNGGGVTGGSGGGLSPDATVFTYMGSYNTDGVPKYLLSQGDVIRQDILNVINASLPAGKSVAVNNPDYIATSAETNLVLKDSAEVWVTFVHEGAAYRNALGYYAFPTNSPPQKASDILKKNIVFPNASFTGSGGDLKSGDKVKLGNFSAGTTISWFLVPDGWSTSQKVVTDARHPVHYSEENFNTYTTESFRSHTVLLKDVARQLFLIGFEDQDRPAGDSDFNDAVFYATVSTFSAVNTTNVRAARSYGIDTDTDGVPDSQDAAAKDPTYAFTQFSPSATQFGSLAFEDAFPLKGDYDMNDMVIDHQFEIRTNAANKVTSIRAKFVLRAMGASFKNGFGFELPVSFDKIASVTGAKLKDNLVSLNSNGTEARQTNAVIMVFDNGFNLMQAADGGFVNTLKGKPIVKPDTINIVINFSTPVSVAELGTAPYNPFIFTNHNRGNEVHLAGYKPTNLANLTLFGKGDDNSGSGKYYQTKNNLPWAIQLPTSFAYPIEKEPINKAYLKFNEWAESKGVLSPDWYKSTPTNIDKTKVY